jgi:predicted peroxiredoxin
MTEAPPRELVVLITHGADHELSSVGFIMARGGLTAGMKVSVFLTSAAIDLVRRRAVELTHVAPIDPLKSQIEDFMARGGSILVCPPGAKARGYTQQDLIDGATITPGSAIHERLARGAASLSF